MVFFKHSASKDQLPSFYVKGTLVENGLIYERVQVFIKAEIKKFNMLANKFIFQVNMFKITNTITITRSNNVLVISLLVTLNKFRALISEAATHMCSTE